MTKEKTKIPNQIHRVEHGLLKKMVDATDQVVDDLCEEGLCDKDQVIIVLIKTNKFGDKEIHGCVPEKPSRELLHGVVAFMDHLMSTLPGNENYEPPRPSRARRHRRP